MSEAQIAVLTEPHLKAICRYLAAGLCCSLVGIGSVGKSSIAAHLTRLDTRQRYLTDGKYTVIVLVKPHLMVMLEGKAVEVAGAAWPGYELMLRRLTDVMTSHLLHSGQEADAMAMIMPQYYGHLVNDNPLLAQAGVRHLEDAVDGVLNMGWQWRLVFILDDLETFLDNLPAHFFGALYGLVDKHRGRFMLATTSHTPLAQLVAARYKSDPKTYSIMARFSEMFESNTHLIPPLESHFAVMAIEYFRQHFAAFNVPARVDSELMMLTGCHGGLLRRGIQCLVHVSDFTAVDVAEILLRDRGIDDECHTIFNSLSPEEQRYLVQVVSGQNTAQNETWVSLRRKYLISRDRDEDGTFRLVIPLLEIWLSARLHQSG